MGLVSFGFSGLDASWSLSEVHASQWPVSNSVLMLTWSAPHELMLPDLAVLNSGWKLNGVPEQSAIEVVWKPLAADACMKPLWCVVRSSMATSNALPPPGAGASNMWKVILSPGFMSSVSLLFTNVFTVASCGDGGPVGTPFRWMKPKLLGSSQFALQVANAAVHSRLSMVRAAHQCVPSQLALSTKGGLPGG